MVLAVRPQLAPEILDSMVHAFTAMALDGTASYAALATAAQTEGGINEQAMKILDEHAAFAPWREAVEAVFRRMERGMAEAG